MKRIKLPIEFPIDPSKKVIVMLEYGDVVVRYRSSPTKGVTTGHGVYCKNIHEVLEEARWFAAHYKILELDLWATMLRDAKQPITFI